MNRNESIAYQNQNGMIQSFESDFMNLPWYFTNNDASRNWPIGSSSAWDTNTNNTTNTTNSTILPYDLLGPFLPMWQQSPLIPALINHDFFNFDPNTYNETLLCRTTGQIITSAIKMIAPPSENTTTTTTNTTTTNTTTINETATIPPTGGVTTSTTTNTNTSVSNTTTTPDPYYSNAKLLYTSLLSMHTGTKVNYTGDPIIHIYVPISSDNFVVAILVGFMQWISYFQNIFPTTEKDIMIVLNDSCTGPSSFLIRGKDVMFVGIGDYHDPHIMII
jgi:hypothetical protein